MSAIFFDSHYACFRTQYNRFHIMKHQFNEWTCCYTDLRWHCSFVFIIIDVIHLDAVKATESTIEYTFHFDLLFATRWHLVKIYHAIFSLRWDRNEIRWTFHFISFYIWKSDYKSTQSWWINIMFISWKKVCFFYSLSVLQMKLKSNQKKCLHSELYFENILIMNDGINCVYVDYVIQYDFLIEICRTFYLLASNNS